MKRGTGFFRPGGFAPPRPVSAGGGEPSSAGAVAAAEPSASAHSAPVEQVSAPALGAAAPAEASDADVTTTTELAATSGMAGDTTVHGVPQAGAPVAVGVPVPPVAPAVPVVRKRVHFVRGRRLPVDARRWAWGAPSTCSTPLPPPPARTVSALEGPIIRRRHPPALQCPQAPPTPAAAQRSPQPTPQPTPRSPHRSLPGPVRCAASRDGVPLLLPPAHLRTCAPACHLRTSAQWPLPTSMPLPMLASEAPTLTLVRA